MARESLVTRRKFLEIMSILAGTALMGWDPAPALAKAKAATKGKGAAKGPGTQYDAIVIGAGLGGLGCAALMARNGLRPLVIEQHTIPGGYATSFTREADSGGTFTCEVSLHSTSAKAPGMRRLLTEMGVYDRLDMVDHELAWTRIGTDGLVDLPNTGLAGLETLLKQRFPADFDDITRLMAYWRHMLAEMDRLESQGPPADLAQFPQAFPILWSVAGSTLQQVLDRHLKNQRLKNFIGMTWGYYGLPPSRLAAFYYLLPMAEYLEHGGVYLRGTSQSLSDALVSVIEQGGGTVLLGQRVTAILTKNGRAAGVKTAAGKSYAARAVVSNASAPATFGMLPSGVMPPEYLNRASGFENSVSNVIVWLGLDREIRSIQPRAEFCIELADDPEASYRAAMAGDWASVGVGVMIYDHIVPGFSPAGTTTLCAMCLSGYEPWRRFEKDYDAGNKQEYSLAKDRAADQIVATVEKAALPGLSKMIVMREVATPLTNRRFTLNPDGAIYGYSQTLDNSFLRRLQNRTPLPGLYLSSAWAMPGGGYGGALAAARGTFKNLVEDLG